MIKIIDGKRYNTETAKEIFEWSNKKYGNFQYRARTLYQTKNGNWFIYDDGGAMTDMAVSAGANSWSGSEDIKLVDEEEAFNFLEAYNAVEAIEKYFSNKIQDV